MKLFVDDIRNPPDESWTLARTVGEAIRAIAKFNFSEISLDHDISHNVKVGDFSRPYPCGETFQSVAYFIREKYWVTKNMTDEISASNDLDEITKNIMIGRLVIPPRITLHTSNTAGAKEMQSILKDYGIDSEIQARCPVNRLEAKANGIS